MLYQKKNNTLEPLTGSTLYAETPIGTVIASFLAVAPSGYIKADDTVYTKAQYPDLYERIPDVFKDTVNETFTIDLREVALKGIGLSSLTNEHYSSTGLTLGEFIEDRVQSHTHSSNRSSTPGNMGTFSAVLMGNEIWSTGENSGRKGNTTEVKSVGVNYFIKARHVALPIDIMDAISEEYATKEYVEDKTSWVLLYPRQASSTTTVVLDLPEQWTELMILNQNPYGTVATQVIIPNGLTNLCVCGGVDVKATDAGLEVTGSSSGNIHYSVYYR